jgi:conjugative relaxase-like TrwC/TraI family protein
MQTTHKIAGSSAVRFARYLLAEASRGDYYTHDGEGRKSAPTQWHGPERLLRSFGIDPEKAVEMEHLGPLMQGFDPVTEKPIRPAGSNGTRVAGIDLSFAPPKEVSALWATTDPYRRAQIEVAHRKAVKSALERTEREVALVRRKTNGHVTFETAKGLLATEVVHTTSRLGKDQDEHGIPDPQLHSHIVVLAAERQDGTLAAVESRQLFKAARENGAWYRAELAANLRELGVGIERRQGNGERYFGVKGVSKALSEHWSSRTDDVHRAANLFRRRYGREPGPGELDSLTLSTRGSKTAASTQEVNAAWRALGEEHNQSAKRSEEAFHDWGLQNDPNVDLAKELLAVVVSERSMITEAELRAKAYELSAGVCRPAEADRLVNDLARSGELLELEDGTWTTRALRELEQETIDIAERRATEVVAPVTERSLAQARREIGKQLEGSLTQEQREALARITGPGGVSVLVGRAGTGKGVVISAAARAWQLEGNEVIGTAIAGSRAQQLKDEAGLDRAHTADGLIKGVEARRIRLGKNTVVVMDEAAMSDHHRLARLMALTAERESKLFLVGDSAQLGAIGPGGLVKELENKVPTAELTEVHRANHEWERQAWEQIRAGEPGRALAQYQAHDRLHLHDTRAQAAEAMVEDWDRTRRDLPGGQAVMITDASNKERDQMNALAQERRAQAGELGSGRVELPEKPYGLTTGDEVIFTAQFYPPGQQRIENGIAGTVIDTDPDQDKVTIRTKEHDPREVNLDTSKFTDLSLAYAVHVNKAQGITAETSGILIGGWQTDREHAYVAASRAREQTQIHVTREDLGEQGLDTGAIERLTDRIGRTRTQEATITRAVIGRDRAEHDRANDPRSHAHAIDDDDLRPHERTDPPSQDRAPAATPDPIPHTQPAGRAAPTDIRQATPENVQITTQDLGTIRLASTQVYDLHAITGEQTHILFGGWQTDKEQGFVAVTQTPQGTNTQISREPRGDRPIETELTERIEKGIEHAHSREQAPTQETGIPARTREPEQGQNQEPEQPAQLEPGERDIDQANGPVHDPGPEQAEKAERDPGPEQAEHSTRDPTPEHTEQARSEPAHIEQPERDPYIEAAIQAARDRQQAWEQGIDQDRDNDHGYGIE